MLTSTLEEAIHTFEFCKEVEIAAPIEVAFAAVLEELGPGGQMPDGKPFPMVIEPWPGGRWYRDLGHNAGHLWGHVQVIKPPTLLELWGPLCMSYPAVSHLQYRLTPQGARTRLKLTHRALGELTDEHREGFPQGWDYKLGRIRQIAERLKKERQEGDSAGAQPGPEYAITRVFAAPRTRVFQAWTDPKRLAQWWGPNGFANPMCAVDLRPGGAYRIVMRGPDGVEYPVKGVYREIVEPERLVMTVDCREHPAAWHDLVNPNRPKGQDNPAGEMLSTVTFDDLDGRTRLTIRMRFESAAIRDALLKMGMNDGWSQSLERLDALLAKG